jgi:ABC-type lipoprotein export system ATPase subunit
MEISLQNIIPEPLEKTYSKSSNVWNKNLGIESGKLIHICAPSGTGKTTLIHLLYGLRSDFVGKLQFNQQDFSGDMEEQWQNLRLNKISIIFQDLKLFEDLTAWENLIIKNQLTNHLSEQEILACVQKLGVSYLLDKKIKHISRGERQRIAIVRSLCMPFDYLLMDEPFSHLDDNNARLAAELILEYCEKNNAGLIMANLEEDAWFPYQLKLKLN